MRIFYRINLTCWDDREKGKYCNMTQKKVFMWTLESLVNVQNCLFLHIQMRFCCWSAPVFFAWVSPVLVSQWCNLTSHGLCTTEMGGLCTAFAFLHASPLGDVKKRSLVQCMCGNRLNSLTVAWEEMNLSETIFLRLDQRNGHINCKKHTKKNTTKQKGK